MYQISDKIIFLLLIILYPLLWPINYIRFKKSDRRRILIVQLSRLGDLICTTPVYRIVKSQYPDLKIAVLTKDYLAPILRDNKYVDEVITVGANYSLYQLVKQFYKGRYTHVFVFTPRVIIAVAAFFALIPSRTSFMIDVYGRLNKMATKLVYNYYNWYVPGKYTVSQYLDLINKSIKLNIDYDNLKSEDYEISFSGSESTKVENLLMKYGFDVRSDYLVGIAIVAGNERKMWPIDKFLSLSQELIKKYNAKIVSIGTDKERDYLDAFASKLGNKNIFIHTNLSINESVALFSKLNFFIAVDCGQLYLAHASGIPVIDIIGVEDRDMFPPIGNRCLVTQSGPVAETKVSEVMSLIDQLKIT